MENRKSQVKVQVQEHDIIARYDCQSEDDSESPYGSTHRVFIIPVEEEEEEQEEEEEKEEEEEQEGEGEEKQYERLRSWVLKNLKKKKCAAFIPQENSDGEICGCGDLRREHLHYTLKPSYLPPDNKWDPQKHVKEFRTDAYGDVTFLGDNMTQAKYVRASSDTDPSKLYTLLTKYWKLQLPRLLISVTGEAKNFNISPRLKTRFSRGLVKVAQSTDAWIITGGSHVGVTKHVGEAIRHFSGASGIVLLGIAPWGVIHNRSYLDKGWRTRTNPAWYSVDEVTQGDLCCLDNNHTHFILVDDGTHGHYGIEIPLRTQLEKYISEQMMHKEAIKIPILCVVLEGGLGTLDTIYNSMCNNTPCVIVEGSGGIADFIVQVSDFSPSKITISLIKDKLKKLFPDLYNSFTEAEFIMLTKKIQDIVRMGSLLTILREETLRDEEVDVAILQALLKASQSTDDNNQEIWDRQLKLAMSLNRADIAETQLFTEDWKWKPSDLHKYLTMSLIENKPSFVRLFLDRGVRLSEYLTRETLTNLYNSIDPSSVIHRKLDRLSKIDGVKGLDLSHVSIILTELLEGLPDFQYIEVINVAFVT